MTLLLLQQLPAAAAIPWWGAAILLLLFIVSGVINVIQLSKGREVARWKSASEAATVELDAVRDRRDRVDTENRMLLAENVALRSKTDLTPLLDSHQVIMKGLMDLGTSLSQHSTEEIHVIRQIEEGLRSVVSSLQTMEVRLTSLDRRTPAAV